METLIKLIKPSWSKYKVFRISAMINGFCVKNLRSVLIFVPVFAVFYLLGNITLCFEVEPYVYMNPLWSQNTSHIRALSPEYTFNNYICKCSKFRICFCRSISLSLLSSPVVKYELFSSNWAWIRLLIQWQVEAPPTRTAHNITSSLLSLSTVRLV